MVLFPTEGDNARVMNHLSHLLKRALHSVFARSPRSSVVTYESVYGIDPP